jgi:ribonuclease HII
VSASLGVRDRELLSDHSLVIGIDEVGRGSLAGPVVVAATGFRNVPENPLVRDSKRLTVRQRERTAEWIRANATSWLVVEVWPEVIDRVNILEATRLAMTAAALELVTDGAVVVSDAVPLHLAETPCESPKRADATFFCVAAASILAKVHRDALMVFLAVRHDTWE